MVLGLDSALKRTIFGGYVVLWVSSHLLVYRSKLSDAPHYNAMTVVLLTETVKLCLAIGLYVRFEGGPLALIRDVARTPALLVKYATPALLYAVYNNLMYVNLTSFDPGTYNVLMQLRIVLTGLLYQALFSKRLNRNQWLAIVAIVFGAALKESSKLGGVGGVVGGVVGGGSGRLGSSLSSWLLLLVQMLCSVLAGLYNEMLLKGGGGAGPTRPSYTVSTHLQNAYMYFNSILVNVLMLQWSGGLREALRAEHLAVILSPPILAIVTIMSSVGLVTGFFLKHLDSVLKAIASALEVFLTCAASWVLFGAPMDPQTLIAAALVAVGVALYARPPRKAGYLPLPLEGGGGDAKATDETV